ncbi:MAG: RNA polymerase sigma factor [Candidatus Eisenbacteria bacterium]
MKRESQGADWTRLLDLLSPIHDDARALARRLARSAADGDDLFQEALLRAFDKISTLREEGSFRSWFYAVLLSVHRSRCRRDFWRRFLSLEDLRGRGREPAGEDDRRLSDEEMRARRVSRALARLPALQREAVVLFEIEDCPVEEIAALQQISVSTAKSRIARGREKLRRYYERLGFHMEGAGPVRRKRRPARRAPGRDDSQRPAWSAAESLPPLETHDG